MSMMKLVQDLSCEYCSNKVNPSCLQPGELKLDEEGGGGYACTGCAYENYEVLHK